MRLHFGNLALDTTAEQLREVSAPYGVVTAAEVVTDRVSGLSRGYGFVVFKSDPEGHAATAGLRGTEINGQPVRIG